MAFVDSAEAGEDSTRRCIYFHIGLRTDRQLSVGLLEIDINKFILQSTAITLKSTGVVTESHVVLTFRSKLTR